MTYFECIIGPTRVAVAPVGTLPIVGPSYGGWLHYIKLEVLMANHIKTNVMRSVERQSEELHKDIRRKMKGVATKMDIAFMTNY